MSKCQQHPTSLQESSAVLPVLHLPTELESKVQTKLEMMLDGMEPMKFHEILHFENLLKLGVHLEFQCDISQEMDTSEEYPCFKSSLQLFIHSSIQKLRSSQRLRFIPFCRDSASLRMPVPGTCPLGLSRKGLRGLLGDLLGLRPRLILSVQRKIKSEK